VPLKTKWLNRNVLAMGMTSFFSDFGHEMATAILPAFVVSIGGSAALLGLIEGTADASISFIKLLSGWYSDRFGKRKPFAIVGYGLTAVGVGSLALATSWVHVLISRIVAWSGRGTREPPRDALLVDSTRPAFHGRVFGFHRGMDTLGAIAGPALAYFLVKALPYHSIFLIALIPSLIAFALIFILVRDIKTPPDRSRQFIGSIRQLPSEFRFFLIAVGVFGLGNFADSMLILRATEVLSPVNGAVIAASLAILLYMLHNIFYSVFSFPIGMLADKFGKKKLLAFGYFLTGVSAIGFIWASANLLYLGFFFILAGIAIAITDAIEKTIAADMLPRHLRGTGYGVLATLNGIGDFASSTVAGFLWAGIAPAAGFGYGAFLAFSGAILMVFLRNRYTSSP